MNPQKEHYKAICQNTMGQPRFGFDLLLTIVIEHNIVYPYCGWNYNAVMDETDCQRMCPSCVLWGVRLLS